MNNKGRDFLAGLVVAPVIYLLITPIGLAFSYYYGWALSQLWEWFVTPLGVPGVGIWEAAGFMVVVGLIKGTNNLKDDDDEYDTMKIAIYLWAPVFAVFYGWIIFQFVS
jgi:hypothetical protein